MALPKSCEMYSRKKLAATRHEYFHTTSPRTSLQEGGFIIYDPSFYTIIGSSPTISIIGENTEIPFAHEAGVYIPETGDVFITSNHIRTAGKKSIQISKVSKSEGKYVVEPIEPGIILANGGVNYRDGVLFCEQGSLTEPGGLVYMESKPPYKTEVLISNFHGRWFNSVNDVVVHSDGSVWFTDPTYGFEQGIRPVPQLKNMTYRFDPKSGDIRAVEDTVVKPNGLCFSPDEKTLYITDTEGVHGDTRCPGVYEPARAASIYAFDIITRHSSPFLANKRLFAYADNGIPDGIKCDTLGNVYSGCGDGVHCWSPGGVLIGEIYVPGGCANFCFGREGEVFLLNEHRMWRAVLRSGVKGDLLKI